MCADVPTEDKTCNKRGSFYKTLENTSDQSVTSQNNVKRKHCIFANRKVLKRESEYEIGKDVSYIVEIYFSFHVREKICGSFKWKLWPKGVFLNLLVLNKYGYRKDLVSGIGIYMS
jgi:hypothetical protein